MFRSSLGVVFLFLLSFVQSLDSKDFQCIECLCHTRTGCYSRIRCAKYSVSKYYWEMAGSISTYKKCMKNEECILNTILNYTSRFGELDTNCDGKFDCKDRFAIHLYGNNSKNPIFSSDYVRRFNDCRNNMNLTALKTEEISCTE